MKKLFCLSIVFFFTLCLFSQGRIQLGGRVIDHDSGEGLPFAHVVITNKNLGTTTDNSGVFNLSVFSSSSSDSIIIRFVGYQDFSSSIENFQKRNDNLIKLDKKMLLIDEVVISAKPIKLDKFMKQAIKAYWQNRRSEPHIALSHYREKAKYNNNYVMFAESIGYAIYAGDRKHDVESRYVFFCDNTRKSDAKPGWLQFADLTPSGDKRSSLGSYSSKTYQSFKNLETSGPLSKKEWKSFNYSLDSSYFENNRKVYVIGFNSTWSRGTIIIFTENWQLISISSSTKVRSTFIKDIIVDCNSKITFVYFDNQPFIKSINLYQKEEGLEYWNQCNTLLQKFDNFDLDRKAVWSLITFSFLPFVDYQPNIWGQYSSIPIDDDYHEIGVQLNTTNMSMEQQFYNNSGKWWIHDYKDEFPEIIIEHIQTYIEYAPNFIKNLRLLF